MREARCRRALLAVLILAATPCVAAPTAPAASASKGIPNAIQGFSQNQGKPVQIEAAALEVHDKDKMATFSGDVHVVQGDTDLRCSFLVVYYEDNSRTEKPSGRGAKTSPAGPQNSGPSPPRGQQQIKRLEAKGNVIVTQKDQIASGDTGVYDFRTNVVTMTGNVVLTKGQDVIRGDRLVVDMTTGVSRVDTTGGQGVRAILNSGSMKELKDAPSAEASKLAPGHPGH